MTTVQIEDGIIEPDTERGDLFGFTADKFSGWLWLRDGRVMVSFIECLEPGQGHFSRLVKRILALGYTAAVPTPFPRMKAILSRWGWTQLCEFDAELGESVEVWSSPQ